MNRIKAFFGGLFDAKASEMYTGWGFVALSAVCMAGEGACAIAHQLHVDTLVPGLIAYTVGRMASKAAKAAK